MNSKMAKETRWSIGQALGVPATETRYQVSAAGTIRLDPTCGRGLYQRTKRLVKKGQV